MTTETKVEAVAWQARGMIDGAWGRWHYIDKADYDHHSSHPLDWYETRALYPQSALDALRGEVERRKSAQAALCQYASAAEQRADAAERRVAELEAALMACNELSAQRLFALNKALANAQKV